MCLLCCLSRLLRITYFGLSYAKPRPGKLSDLFKQGEGMLVGEVTGGEFSGKFSILITGRVDIIKGIILNKKI